MTRVCRACDEVIVPQEAAVWVAHEEAASGPGWNIWAHREHVDDVQPIDPVLARALVRIAIAKALRSA